jgi:hypothetical protein
MYLAGVSVRRVEDIRQALLGQRVPELSVSHLNREIFGKSTSGCSGHWWASFRMCSWTGVAETVVGWQRCQGPTLAVALKTCVFNALTRLSFRGENRFWAVVHG